MYGVNAFSYVHSWTRQLPLSSIPETGSTMHMCMTETQHHLQFFSFLHSYPPHFISTLWLTHVFYAQNIKWAISFYIDQTTNLWPLYYWGGLLTCFQFLLLVHFGTISYWSQYHLFITQVQLNYSCHAIILLEMLQSPWFLSTIRALNMADKVWHHPVLTISPISSINP